ncbi:hypothetical protein OUZ56_005196 [Daphnia magna]|uniref:Uncharacterized protein n=1 Tax=Daphnia magna TaxID=35525 RepID=A0ABQ9YSE3_9CRUS|nr:hypothetical protein OUZ56_005196 [Daphnia magna]
MRRPGTERRSAKKYAPPGASGAIASRSRDNRVYRFPDGERDSCFWDPLHFSQPRGKEGEDENERNDVALIASLWNDSLVPLALDNQTKRK